MKPLIVVGAGGHAAVVADALLTAGEHVLGFVDADPALHGRIICGLPVLGDDRVLGRHAPDALQLVNGIGGIRGEGVRETVQRRLEELGWQFATVRHATAVVSRFSKISDAVHLLATSVVQAGAQIGKGCIVNTGAVIEHDSALGEYVHVAPGSVVCGNVTIGARSHIGAGAVIRQGIQLGEDTIVGAGAVVVESFAGNGVLVGTPARLTGCLS